MATGLLVVEGTLDLSQFWPEGNSDADTTKVLVTPGPQGFQYQPAPNQPFESTDVFDGASVKGKSGKKPVQDKQGRLTIRLQGIDAAELHYQPQSVLHDPPAHPKAGETYRTPKQKKAFLAALQDFRQRLGETATVKLHAHLTGLGGPILPCRVETAVDAPNAVFDCYGRFVGDVLVGAAQVNINDWLVEQGLAFPAFYSSMSEGEIKPFLAKVALARQQRAGLWAPGCYSATVGRLNPNLIYRRAQKGHAAPQPDDDDAHDKVIFPKLFRRLATWTVNRQAGMLKGSFVQYLASQKGDVAMYLSDYLSQGNEAAPLHRLADLIKDGVFQPKPEDLVFREDPSTLVPRPGRSPTWQPAP